MNKINVLLSLYLMFLLNLAPVARCMENSFPLFVPIDIRMGDLDKKLVHLAIQQQGLKTIKKAIRPQISNLEYKTPDGHFCTFYPAILRVNNTMDKKSPLFSSINKYVVECRTAQLEEYEKNNTRGYEKWPQYRAKNLPLYNNNTTVSEINCDDLQCITDVYDRADLTVIMNEYKKNK